MNRARKLQRFSKAVNLPAEPLPGMPIIEIVGDCRVLIERHLGVLEYDHCRIHVKTGVGNILVCGSGMELLQMTKQQLVICGTIVSVCIEKKGC